MPDYVDKLFTNLVEMEIIHKWSINNYLLQTFYRLFICVTINVVLSALIVLFLQAEPMKPSLGE